MFPSNIMFLGIDADLALTVTVIVATVWTAFAMLAVVFFAWAPHFSEKWRTQLGATAEIATTDDSSAD